MKKLTRLICLMLCVMLLGSTITFLAACGDDKKPPAPATKFTVRFLDGNGVLSTQQVNAGAKVTAPTARAVDGKTFAHWYSPSAYIAFDFANTTITANTDITAYYTTDNLEHYTLTFDVDGGSPAYLAVTLDAGTVITNLPCTKSKHILEKWINTADESAITFPKTLNANLSLKAIWEEAPEVTFDPNGGTLAAGTVSPVAVKRGAYVAEPANPTRKNFSFLHWGINSTTPFAFTTTPVTEDITLKAFWETAIDPTSFDPLILNIGDPDEKFSPFFSTSAYDGAVHGNTQIALITSNSEGKIAMGEDLPTVAFDWTETTFVNGEPVDADKVADAAKDLGTSQRNNPEYYRTEYEFVIKNGIKFSDGEDLTIEDVIFNMYVYLDPVYSGSSTMYSTRIVGLPAYRNDDPTITYTSSENRINELDILARSKASDRLIRLTNYFDKGATLPNLNSFRQTYRDYYRSYEYQAMQDVQWMRENYYTSLKSDWNSLSGSDIEQDFKEYGFTEAWEAFLFYNGVITAVYDKDGEVEKNPDGTLKVNYNGSQNWYTKEPELLINYIFNRDVGVVTNVIPTGKGNNPNVRPDVVPTTDLTFDPDTGAVTGSSIPFAPSNLTKEAYLAQTHSGSGNCRDEQDDGCPYVHPMSYFGNWWESTNTLMGLFAQTGANPVFSSIESMVKYSSTGNNARIQFTAEEKTAELEKRKTSGKRNVEKIDGIEVLNTSDSKYNNTFNGKQLSESHHVLKITIVGVDPKAKWNFAFAVAPMHYYSDARRWGNDFTAEQGFEGFNYPGTPSYNNDKAISPGFPIGNKDYFDKIINNQTIMRVPVGAGAFMATNQTNTAGKINNNTEHTRPSEFFANNTVYFKMNNYFHTTGKGVTNTKFAYMRYIVVPATSVPDNLIKGTIHIGDPNATEKNQTRMQGQSHLTAIMAENNGYGYVGINATFIPDLDARKAIMYALNKDTIINTYYAGGLAQHIDRPMSRSSWAYPENPSVYYRYTNDKDTGDIIKGLISKYSSSGGVLQYTDTTTGLRTRLEFTMTIAGSDVDHPAYTMFTDAAALLNSCGFKVKVATDSQALLKLSAGTLAVWAAAWNTSIDPDMFQTYHKDSQAQSVNNWGYSTLLATYQNDSRTPEYSTIVELSKIIDQARESTDDSRGGVRAQLYAQALDKVMDLAVEYPTYQRNNLNVFNHQKIDGSTLNTKTGAYDSLIEHIWEVVLLK